MEGMRCTKVGDRVKGLRSFKMVGRGSCASEPGTVLSKWPSDQVRVTHGERDKAATSLNAKNCLPVKGNEQYEGEIWVSQKSSDNRDKKWGAVESTRDRVDIIAQVRRLM